jgi:hypothetical protein
MINIRSLSLVIVGSVLLLSISGCDSEAYKNRPIDVLATDFGTVITGKDGKPEKLESSSKPITAGTHFYWKIYYRSNRDVIKFTELQRLSAPSEWNVAPTLKHKIYEDGRLIAVEREVPNTGEMAGVWSINDKDPKGEGVTAIVIDGVVVHRFQFEIQ